MATLSNIAAANYNITYYTEDVFDLSIAVTDASGNAVDLSAKSLVFTIKKNYKYTEAVQTLTSASGITVSGASNNIVTFNADWSFEQDRYAYDLHNITDNETIMYGAFILTQNIHN
jgi:hypothetical protein